MIIDYEKLFIYFYLFGFSLVISILVVFLRPKLIKISPIISVIIGNIVFLLKFNFILSDIVHQSFDGTTIFALQVLLPLQAFLSIVIAIIVWAVYCLVKKLWKMK